MYSVPVNTISLVLYFWVASSKQLSIELSLLQLIRLCPCRYVFEAELQRISSRTILSSILSTSYADLNARNIMLMQ